MSKEQKEQTQDLRGSTHKEGRRTGLFKFCAALAIHLLFFASCIKSPSAVEISQGAFWNMLAKGDVADVVIVNKSTARIFLVPDSATASSRYINPKDGKFLFTDKSFEGPHFFVTLPSIDYFLINMEKVQADAGIEKNRQIFPRSAEEDDLRAADWLAWLLPAMPLLLILLVYLLIRRARKRLKKQQLQNHQQNNNNQHNDFK